MSLTALPAWLPWLVAAIIAATGLWLGLRAWFGDRARGRPRCPRCWYSMVGAPSRRCPECGHEARSEREFFRTRRRRGLALLGLLLVIGPLGFLLVHGHWREIVAFLRPRWTPIDDVQLGGFRVQTFRSPPESDAFEGLLRIRNGGQVVYEQLFDSPHVELGCAVPNSNQRIGLGGDINGDSAGDLVISEYSGGAHCCYTFTILSLGTRTVTPLAIIQAQHGARGFEDRDGDGVMEFIATDYAFAYWNAPWVASPSEEVVLRWRGDRFQLAPDLMSKPLPSAEALRQIAGQVRTDPEWKPNSPPPPLLWATMLDLIYTGHESAAYAFFDEAWRPDMSGKQEFLAEFRKQLTQSSYWPELQRIGKQ